MYIYFWVTIYWYKSHYFNSIHNPGNVIYRLLFCVTIFLLHVLWHDSWVSCLLIIYIQSILWGKTYFRERHNYPLVSVYSKINPVYIPPPVLITVISYFNMGGQKNENNLTFKNLHYITLFLASFLFRFKFFPYCLCKSREIVL